MGALRPSVSLVLFTDRMVTNCPIWLRELYTNQGVLSSQDAGGKMCGFSKEFIDLIIIL